MKKYLKSIPLNVCLAILCAFMLCVLVFLIDFRNEAESKGRLIGEGTGTIVGRAIGSFEGITEGQIAGYQAGKDAGLSSNDITVELAGQCQEIGKLQVLASSGVYSDVLTVGEDVFAVLLSVNYNAVFTVDLTSAEIKLEGKTLHILLDQPEVEFKPVDSFKIREEYQKDYLLVKPGSTEDMFDRSLKFANTMKKTAEAEYMNDASMMENARKSAENQIIQLVNAVAINKPEVIVTFRDNG